MKNIAYDLIDSYLGNHQERYFSQGYKHFSYSLENLSYTKEKLTGDIILCYTGPRRPRNEMVHLGSMEFTATTLHITEYAMQKLLGLSVTEISRSFPIKLDFRNATEITFEQTITLPFSCTLINTALDLHAQNIGISRFKIFILSAKLEIVMDHPGASYIQLPPKENLHHVQTVYQSHYQNKSNALTDITINSTTETIQAKVYTQYADSKPLKQTGGISCSKQQILATDFISVTGQLMQVLLYAILQTNRSDCPSIFLRSMTLAFNKPKPIKNYTISVSFSKRKSVFQNNNNWHIIELKANLAHISGRFNICHIHPKSP